MPLPSGSSPRASEIGVQVQTERDFFHGHSQISIEPRGTVLLEVQLVMTTNTVGVSAAVFFLVEGTLCALRLESSDGTLDG